jgi:hypothetical protein
MMGVKDLRLTAFKGMALEPSLVDIYKSKFAPFLTKYTVFGASVDGSEFIYLPKSRIAISLLLYTLSTFRIEGSLIVNF